MTNRIVVLGCLWILVLAASLTLTAGAGPSVRKNEAIRRLIATYAKAVDAADASLAATVWATTPDVSLIHPLGHERGWEAVRTNLYEKILGGFFSERKLTIKDPVVHAYGDAAWVEFYWDFVATSRKDGSTITTHGRETQIYRRTHGRWQLVHVHYSGLPAAEQR